VARNDALLDARLDEEALHPGGGLRLRADGVEGLAGLEEDVAVNILLVACVIL
jgi:hypothetical protein